LLIDDLEVIYGPSGINEHVKAEPFLFEAHNKLIINLKNENEYINQWFYLINIKGQTVLSSQLASNEVDLPEQLPHGVYVAVLKGKSRQYSQKISIP